MVWSQLWLSEEGSMRSIGVRELKEQATRILRRVREKGEEVQVTYRGRPVARLIPVSGPRSSTRERAAVWSDLDRLAVEIGARWPVGLKAAEAVREGRREL
jgi:prevent-host-death family protein